MVREKLSDLMSCSMKGLYPLSTGGQPCKYEGHGSPRLVSVAVSAVGFSDMPIPGIYCTGQVLYLSYFLRAP